MLPLFGQKLLLLDHDIIIINNFFRPPTDGSAVSLTFCTGHLPAIRMISLLNSVQTETTYCRAIYWWAGKVKF